MIVKVKYKKDNLRETIMLEVAAWTFVIGVIYIFLKAVF